MTGDFFHVDISKKVFELFIFLSPSFCLRIAWEDRKREAEKYGINADRTVNGFPFFGLSFKQLLLTRGIPLGISNLLKRR